MSMTNAIIDPRCASWISVEDGTDYKVAQVYYYAGVEAQGEVTFDVLVTNKGGRRMLYHEKVTVALPDASDDFWTRADGVRYTMSGDSSFSPDRGESGPYTVIVGDAKVRGLGLPLRQHVQYLIVIAKQVR